MTDYRNRQTSGKLLAFDTSTAAMTIAVMDGDTLLGETHSRAERNHSIRLVPSIEQLLRFLNMTAADLDGIAVGRGPGSYTGVRIGVTVAKTFAWARGLPLIGVSSLAALAFGGIDQGRRKAGAVQWAVPLMDARRGQVYTGIYGAGGPITWDCIMEDGIRLMSRFAVQVAERAESAQLKPDVITFIGEVEPFREAICRVSDRWRGEVAAVDADIRACNVGRLAWLRWAEGEREAVHDFVPNYTQLAEAEAKWLARQKEKGEGADGGICTV